MDVIQQNSLNSSDSLLRAHNLLRNLLRRCHTDRLCNTILTNGIHWQVSLVTWQVCQKKKGPVTITMGFLNTQLSRQVDHYEDTDCDSQS